MKLRVEAEANRSEIRHYIRNKLRNLAFSEEIATHPWVLAMTDAIDTCNSYRWIWDTVCSLPFLRKGLMQKQYAVTLNLFSALRRILRGEQGLISYCFY